MPYSGTLDVGPLIAEAPLMAGFDAEASSTSRNMASFSSLMTENERV